MVQGMLAQATHVSTGSSALFACSYSASSRSSSAECLAQKSGELSLSPQWTASCWKSRFVSARAVAALLVFACSRLHAQDAFPRSWLCTALACPTCGARGTAQSRGIVRQPERAPDIRRQERPSLRARDVTRDGFQVQCSRAAAPAVGLHRVVWGCVTRPTSTRPLAAGASAHPNFEATACAFTSARPAGWILRVSRCRPRGRPLVT